MADEDVASRNVEIKAKLVDVVKAHEISAKLSGQSGTILHQTDTFYYSKKGRMKMRIVRQDEELLAREELIYYERPDSEGPKTSTFYKVEGSGVAGGLSPLHQLLSASLGLRGQVVKTRSLYLVGQTRVHIDQVKDLGDFIELEVVLSPEETPEQGQKIAEELMHQLGINKDDLISQAYMDLLEANKT